MCRVIDICFIKLKMRGLLGSLLFGDPKTQQVGCGIGMAKKVGILFWAVQAPLFPNNENKAFGTCVLALRCQWGAFAPVVVAHLRQPSAFTSHAFVLYRGLHKTYFESFF